MKKCKNCNHIFEDDVTICQNCYHQEFESLRIDEDDPAYTKSSISLFIGIAGLVLSFISLFSLSFVLVCFSFAFGFVGLAFASGSVIINRFSRIVINIITIIVSIVCLLIWTFTLGNIF